jgi:hypothetical protein
MRTLLRLRITPNSPPIKQHPHTCSKRWARSRFPVNRTLFSNAWSHSVTFLRVLVPLKLWVLLGFKWVMADFSRQNAKANNSSWPINCQNRTKMSVWSCVKSEVRRLCRQSRDLREHFGSKRGHWMWSKTNRFDLRSHSNIVKFALNLTASQLQATM